jgi:hypothetical protein
MIRLQHPRAAATFNRDRISCLKRSVEIIVYLSEQRGERRVPSGTSRAPALDHTSQGQRIERESAFGTTSGFAFERTVGPFSPNSYAFVGAQFRSDSTSRGASVQRFTLAEAKEREPGYNAAADRIGKRLKTSVCNAN